MTGQLLTIVPREHKPGTPVVTNGTKVLTQDGTEIGGITKITIVGEVNALWRAVIECHVDMQRMEGIEGEIKKTDLPEPPRPPLMRMIGNSGGCCPKCGSSEKRAWMGFGKAIV